jgi:hypothetical protein
MTSGELANYLQKCGCEVEMRGNANVILVRNKSGRANFPPGLERVYPFIICQVCHRLAVAVPAGINCNHD